MILLRNGVRAFDLTCLARCGARTRSGTVCRRYGRLRNGRCRLHGGASTGPGLAARLRLAARSLRHGYYAGATRRWRALLWAEIAALGALLSQPEPCRTRRRCGWARVLDAG